MVSRRIYPRLVIYMYSIRVWYIDGLRELVELNREVFNAAFKFYFDDSYKVSFREFGGLDKYADSSGRVNAKKLILDPPIDEGDKDSIDIFLVDKDIYLPGFSYVFAVTHPPLSRIVISLFRLLRKYSLVEFEEESVVKERLFKEIMHELGHLTGLEHCDNKLCVMSFSKNLKELDAKVPYPCEKCIEKLEKISKYRL